MASFEREQNYLGESRASISRVQPVPPLLEVRRDFISGIDGNFPNGSLKINRAAQRDLSDGGLNIALSPLAASISRYLSMRGNVITVSSFSTLCLLVFSTLPTLTPLPPSRLRHPFMQSVFSGLRFSFYIFSLFLSLSVPPCISVSLFLLSVRPLHRHRELIGST